ncbi:unnamed protein product [Mytilus edulis]|uniref:Cadherin domain-containing protein n=1 Tax=Mytilus edulis TaxID=6550 RepID=A0A8S3QYX5_MYTED|nr:unnamed protein product [Mytilus edulis]
MFGVYLVLICFPAYTSAVACGVKTVGGTNLGGGTYTNWDNTTTGAGYLAKAYILDCCGLLSGFNVEIAGLGTIYLQIWRQSVSTYKLVHSSQYTFSTADALTVHYLPIDDAEQPTILENDMLGWYTSGTDMVPYDNGAGAVNQNYRVDAGSASGPTPFNSGSLLSGRSYAINFVTAVNSAPFFTNGGTKVSFLDTKTVSLGITLYQMSVTDDNKDDTALTVEMTNAADTTFISDLRHRIKSSAANWKVGEYTLEYSVKDQCLNEGTTYVIVGVNNTAPEIRNTVISYNIKENNNDETQIMSLTVTDKQTYRCNLGTVSPNDGILIIKQPTETDPFNLYLKGGSMKDIDNDAKPQYTVTAVCTDDYGLATEKIFYVNVEKNIEPVIDVLPNAVIFGSIGGVTGLLFVVALVIVFIKRSSILKMIQESTQQNNSPLYENDIGLQQQVYQDLNPFREDINSPYDVMHTNNSPLYEHDIGLENQVYQDLTPDREDNNTPYDELHIKIQHMKS